MIRQPLLATTRLLICLLLILCNNPLHAQTQAPTSESLTKPRLTKVCLLHLSDPGADVIGVHVRADLLREAIAAIPDDQHPDILILRLATDGGQIAETPLLAELLHKELLPTTRTILWVERARSAGALFAFACPEIFVTTESVIGPARAHDRSHPDDIALESTNLDKVLAIAERLAKMGAHDPALLHAMMIPEPQHPHPSPDLLELDAQQAVERGLAIGVADDLAALLALLNVEEHTIVGAHAGRTLRANRANLVEAERKIMQAWLQLDEVLTRVEQADASPTRQDAMLSGRDLRTLRAFREQYTNLAVHLGLSESILADREDRHRALVDAVR